MARKQAVVLIHGIGEQKPMQTLRAFVNAVWTQDTVIHHKFAGYEFWSKPDNVSDSYELRKLTTPQNTGNLSTDFFEFYWAHLMEGTTYGHVAAWVKSILWRKPSTVPKHLKPLYWLLIILVLMAIGFTVYTLVRLGNNDKLLPTWVSTLITPLLLLAVGFIALKVVGDAARYLHVAPANVQSRHTIRRAGVTLLNALHERGYERIIIVGHSLGSVIGYDILKHAWVSYHNKPPKQAASMEALEKLEEIAISEPPPSVDEVQKAQRQYFNELVKNENKWRVTDFITLGSPLAHAALLLADEETDLLRRCNDRELPTCPPTLEKAKRYHTIPSRFSFESDSESKVRIPHHAAVFAPTRWTNLYFPRRWIVFGDLVGGAIAPLFGRGVRDIPVSTKARLGLLCHTLYWTCPKTVATAEHIDALRKALDLTDKNNH